MPEPWRKISSHFAWTPQGWLSRPILSFDSEGRLVGIETSEQLDNQHHVEFFSGVLIPGLVNAHAHTEFSYLKGQIARGGGFADFADQIGRLRHRTPENERIAAAVYWDAKMYSEGISAVGDICNRDFTFETKRHSPIFYHNFIEYFGLGASEFPATDAVAVRAQERGLSWSPTPHATYSLNDAPFRKIVADSPLLSIHFMESRAEKKLFDGEGALYERYERLGLTPDFLHYGSPTDRLLACMPSGKKVLLIHNTFVGEEEIQRIESDCAGEVFWVLCPRSNEYIEGQLPAVDRLQKCRVRIALGTDSLASNVSLSLVDEMKCFGEVPLHERIRWATLNGAQALGIDAWAGSFEVGKRPGVVLLTGADPRTETLRPEAATRRIL